MYTDAVSGAGSALDDHRLTIERGLVARSAFHDRTDLRGDYPRCGESPVISCRSAHSILRHTHPFSCARELLENALLEDQLPFHVHYLFVGWVILCVCQMA